MTEEIERYSLNIDSFEVEVRILGERKKGREYAIEIPQIAEGTKALIEEIKRKLTVKITITPEEVLDPKSVEELKEKISREASALIKENLPNISESAKNYLVVDLINHTIGLGDIEFLMVDPSLEEIVIPQAGVPVRVYHKKHGWLTTTIVVKTEKEIMNYSSILARRVGKQITTLTPLLDARMVTGDRSNAVLFPISTKGNTITIRKFAREPWTIVDFIKSKTISSGVAAVIWMGVQYEMNILVSGGTASGKTSLLNVMMAFMPLNHRIISIEDTRELQLPETLYWAPLVTRSAGPEGEGAVTMLDLLVNSLRMRPDRVIMGEVRRGEDAMVLFEAMHTGHSVYATVHADTAAETIRRLVNPPISVPGNLLRAVDLNVVMFRDRRKGIRRVSQVAEFSESEGEVRTNILYRWEPADDRIVAHGRSTKFFEDLSRNTGLSQDDIKKDIMNKKLILDWMVQKNIRSLTKISEIMKDYYLDPDSILKKARAEFKLPKKTDKSKK